jgi:tellurite resistance protein TerC
MPKVLSQLRKIQRRRQGHPATAGPGGDVIQALLQSAPWWAWAGFHLLVFILLALDLGVFNREAHTPSFKEAAGWSCVWIALALIFNGVVWYAMGTTRAAEFFTGYLLEKSLSVDNLFVFILLFEMFQVPGKYQHRILFWGILGALVMRGAMILGGTALLHRFEWMIYVFGLFLIFTGVKMMVVKDKAEPEDPRDSWLARSLQAILPYDPEAGYQHFMVRKGHLRYATPAMLVLLVVDATDLVFAVDSIPAVLAVTMDPFIVYTSNIFAILGMRALYFLLVRMVDRFHYLKLGVALVLVFVGAKMCLMKLLPISIGVSLLVIALVLGVCITASLMRPHPVKNDR